MAYEQGEIRDSANNIILAGSWGIKTPFKDIINILTENGRALKNDGISTAASVPWAGVTGKPTTLAGYGITDAYSRTASDAKYAPYGYGLGTVSKQLTTGTDLNTVTINGMYYIVTPVNKPSTLAACYLFVQSFNSNYIQQTCYDYASPATWQRTMNNSVWSAWKQSAFTDGPTFTGTSKFGSNIQIIGTTTGVGNVAFIEFYESNGTTRTGYIGDGSSANSDITVKSDSGRVVLSGTDAVITKDNGASYHPIAPLDDAIFTSSLGVVSSGVSIGASFSSNFKIQTPTLKGMRLGYNPTNNNAVIAPIENQSNALDIAFYDATSGTMLPKATFLSNGFVGIGDTNPSRMLTINNSFGSTGTLLAYNTNASYTGVVGQFKTEATANATILRCDSGATTGVFSVFANGIVSTAGQIKFPITQNASSDPNTLDDYEEGNWTPNDSSGAGLTLTPVADAAQYTKIGRFVIATCFVAYPTTAANNGATISGLPFASSSYFSSTMTTSSGLNIVARTTPSAASMAILNTSNGLATVAQLSGKSIGFTIIYTI
ncbi:pyocin knob domain-containing protein [Sporomusa sp. KB1]|jgi:hypothetical protein|uniref:pyocin knob domain-containing protein n=1 Tax=Sporomusa sp. KB1 TaxID=943346 RepID=UPI00119CB5E6|nr:pyocin knob domain-containing protein [Sporomusa sp. KB1]TWH49584.1 hypothetical protein Salpa_5822 [Sporomusa sp. KB1]